MEMLFGIIGAISGITGIVVSIVAFYHNQMEAVNAYYVNDRDERYIEARRIVHHLPENYSPKKILDEHGSKLAYLVLSYDQAGTLLQNRQLPFWLFNTSSGYAAVQFYNILLPYIEWRRDNGTPLYGQQYKYLVKRILRKHPEWKDAK